MSVSRPDPRRGSLVQFAQPHSADLIGRTAPLAEWARARMGAGLWPYGRSLHTAPDPYVELEDVAGRVYEGINLGSQDYLGLASEPSVVEAAVEAARRYGVHSGGSGVLAGGSTESLLLERELGELVRAQHVLIFPTGWAAGFGAIVGLVRPYDHVLLDEVAHSCLQAGANAATGNVVRHRHLDVEAVRAELARIRATDTRAGILVVTEGLYSMDADVPALRAMIDVCREYGGTLMVDQAHDLGASGPDGTGQAGIQGVLGEVDLVMGAFSKTFVGNGGFIASNSFGVKVAITAYAGSFTFSNALAPMQLAAVRESLRIVRDPEGDRRRDELIEVSSTLRKELDRYGLTCLGIPSAVNPVVVGSEAVTRTACLLAAQRGVLVNLVEFPAVARNACRLRLQAMSTHSPDQMRTAARVVAESIADAHAMVDADTEPATLPAPTLH
jgi:7-keto-8-aminopelargonate synthetase-like enzyme